MNVGQRVVCKDDSGENVLIKGSIYTIDSFSYCFSCEAKCASLKEVELIGRCICDCGTSLIARATFHIYRFEPLKYDLISNEDVLKNIIEEKQDIEIEKVIPEKVNE